MAAVENIRPLAKPANRRLQSWINGFQEYARHMGLPALFKQWAAVSAVSGALERRCTLTTTLGPLAPNLFVVLVSPPGVGKSVIIKNVSNFWSKTKGLVVAPSSMTRAGLIKFMLDTKKVETEDNTLRVTHSVLCASSEFGNLVPAYENAWLNTLNDIYDCGEYFSDMTRQHGELRLEHPHMVILAGTQPKYLDNLLPETAFGMGFTSRIIMVYAGEKKYTSLFDRVERSGKLEEWLTEDMASIALLRGDFYLSPEAKDHWDSLAPQGFQPIPTHSKLQHYNARREAHMLKLMMCFSAAERNDLKITPSHIDSALKLLLETEIQMPQIFQEMVTKGYADANEEVWSYAMQTWMTNGRKAIPESAMIKFMVGKVPNNQIKQTLDLMTQSGSLKAQTVIIGGLSQKTYTPQRKE